MRKKVELTLGALAQWQKSAEKMSSRPSAEGMMCAPTQIPCVHHVPQIPPTRPCAPNLKRQEAKD
jgi:hypothetical protein